MDMNFFSGWTWALGGAKSTSGTAADAKSADAASVLAGTKRTCTTGRADLPGAAPARTIWKYSAPSAIEGSMSVFFLAKAIFRFNLGVRLAAARQKLGHLCATKNTAHAENKPVKRPASVST